VAPIGLYARLCHAFLVYLFFVSHTSGSELLHRGVSVKLFSVVCSVQNIQAGKSYKFARQVVQSRQV